MGTRKSQIDILASLVHPRGGHRWKNLFMMLECYFDESGIHEEARVCVVGGYFAHQAIWRKFERQWNKIISEYSELSEEGFHAKRFFARDPQGERVSPYKGWSDDKANEFLNRLVQCVVRNGITPVGYGIVVRDFLARSEKSRQWFTGAKFSTDDGRLLTSGCPSKSYYVPFQWCVLDPAKIHRHSDTVEKIHYFVGLDRTFHEYAATLFAHLLRDPRIPASLLRSLGSINNPRASETPGLQAADLFANRLYQQMRLFLVNSRESRESEPIRSLAKNRLQNQKFLIFNAETMDAIEKFGIKEYGNLVAEGRVQEHFDALKKQ